MSQTSKYQWVNGSFPAGFSCRSIAYGPGRWVAVGDYGAAISSDGVNWSQVTPASQTPYSVGSSIAYGNGIFVCVAQIAGSSAVKSYVSADGVSWTEGAQVYGYCVTFGNGSFVLGSGATSTDGITWHTPGTYRPSGLVSGICYGKGVFAAASSNNMLYVRAANEQDWHTAALSPAPSSQNDEFLCSVYYRDGLFLAGATNRLYASRDGETWTEAFQLPGYDFTAIAGEEGCYLARAYHHTLGTVKTFSSADGTNWQEDSGAGAFSIACAQPAKLLLAEGAATHMGTRFLPDYRPDGETLCDDEETGMREPAQLVHRVALMGKYGARPGQVYQKLDADSFGFGDVFAPPKNALYADASEGLASLTAKLAALGAPSQNVTVYLTGDWKIPMHKDGAGYAEAKSAVLVPQNVTLDGRYGKLTLTFSGAADPGHTGMAAFRMGQGSALRNFQVYSAGAPQDIYLFVFADKPLVTIENNVFHSAAMYNNISYQGHVCLYGTKSTFRGNTIDGLSGYEFNTFVWGIGSVLVSENLFTGTINGQVDVLIGGSCSVIANRFADLTCNTPTVLINASGPITGNTLYRSTVRENFIKTSGRSPVTGNYLIDVTFTGEYSYPALINAYGSGIISGNSLGPIRMQNGGAAILCDGNNAVVCNNLFYLNGNSTETGYMVNLTAVYSDRADTTVEGNSITYTTTAQPCLPLYVTGARALVKNNRTNLNTIGTVEGADQIVADNITGTKAPDVPPLPPEE